MESNNKGTIYQQLNSYFYGIDNTINGTAIQQPQQPQKIIIKGNTPEEIRQKGLELQQKQDLLSKFNKTTDRSYQKALQYEAARLPAYMDYEGMEFFPLISSALDLFMEEATTIGSNGKMLNIYSNNERIKVALEDLFYNTIKINVNLPFWTRNLAKYGDNFCLIYGERKQGITHVKQMVNYEIERIERIENGKPTTKFKDRLTGSEFNIFEVAHFRLLGDDKFIPYGSCLASNSYIKTNKGVKQIKDINIGDVVIGFDIKSQKKIESKVLDTIYSGKKNIFKISTRHNYIDASKEHKILIYDNENNFRYEFVDNLKIGDRLIINTYDNSNEIIDIDKTEIFTVDKIKREFHYYQNINCIPDKMTPELAQLIGFMFGDGWISNNKDVSFALGEYDSQNLKYINLLEKFSGVKPRLIKPSIKRNYEYSQVTVGSKMLANILNQLGFKGNAHTKRIPNWVFNATREIRESFLNGFVDADGSTFIDKWNCVRYAIELCNKDLANDLKYLVQSLGYKSGKISYRNKANKPMIENRIINGGDSYYFYFFKSLNHQTKNNDISNRLTDDFIIEPIISIEENGVSDVYDIHVDNENHNFYANNIVVHNSILNKVRRVFRQLCLDSNSIIWTENGYKKIKDLTLDDIIYSYDYNNNKVIKTKIKNIYKTGEKNRIKLKTRHREIILTEDHPVLIKNIKNEFEYKNVSNILHNDKLILPTINDNINDSFKIKLNSNYYHVILNDEGKKKISEISSKNIMKTLNDFGCKTSIKNLHSFIKGYNRSILYNDYLKIMNYFNLTLDDVDLHYFNSRKKAIVNKNLEFTVDDKFIKLFGFMLGDGWINYPNNTVGFALGVYENENEYYLNLFKNLGEFNYRINPPKKNTGGQINFQSTELLKIFEALDFKTGCFNKIIPNWVYDLSYDNKISFINGIFDADGCDSNHLYSSSNHELIKSLRVLAQTCNIQVGNIIKTKTNNKFQDKIVNRKDSYCLYINHNKNEFSSYQEEKITSTEIMGIGEVWDIEVDNDLHNFIADGIVVHNCMAEDSMLTNRLLRAGDKRVFKIDVGNIDEEDVEEYMYKVATKFKRTPQVAPNDGQIDYRFNILGNDEDYFLPLRNGNSLTGIDTLQGSSTLDAIHDIEYLRDNLFIGLGIPKPFLSFQDASGAGKNMAQFDVRFAKKVIRLQQAMIEELNKMAIIHLMLLGFSESDIRDFQLTLTNPSIQHDLLKSELLREQAQTYTELTRGENGIAAMSHTRAKRLVFNMSDVDIVEDLKQQKMEKVVMQELADAPVLIKKSGLFADIDKKFGNETALIGAASGETTQGGEMPAFSPGGGPMNEPPMGGDAMGGAPTPPANGGAPSAPTEGNELPPISEQFTNYIYKLVGLNIKENNISTIAAATDIILENEKINNITFNLLKETNNIAEQDDIDINEINID